MTDGEAEKIVKVLSEADGGCPHCFRELLDYMDQSLPERNWVELAKKLLPEFWGYEE